MDCCSGSADSCSLRRNFRKTKQGRLPDYALLLGGFLFLRVRMHSYSLTKTRSHPTYTHTCWTMRKTDLDVTQLPLSSLFVRKLGCVGTASSLMAPGRWEPLQQSPFASLAAWFQCSNAHCSAKSGEPVTAPLQGTLPFLHCCVCPPPLSWRCSPRAQHREFCACSLAKRRDVRRRAEQGKSACVESAQQHKSKQTKSGAALPNCSKSALRRVLYDLLLRACVKRRIWAGARPAASSSLFRGAPENEQFNSQQRLG